MELADCFSAFDDIVKGGAVVGSPELTKPSQIVPRTLVILH